MNLTTQKLQWTTTPTPPASSLASVDWAQRSLWLREVYDFPGYYITNDGRVLSLRFHGIQRTRRWAWLTQRAHPRTGHLRVDLYRDKKPYRGRGVHILVAQSWLGPTPNDDEGWPLIVCHKDGNPQNNSVHNLYWGTTEDNARDRERHKYQGEFTGTYEPDPRWGF